VASGVVFAVHSAVTSVKPDFVFLIASEKAVTERQGNALAAVWEENVDGVTSLKGNTLFMGDGTMLSVNMLMLWLIDEECSVFIIGESMIEALSDQFEETFHTMEELDLPADGPFPELASLENSWLMQELGFTQEPMYALIKRPIGERDDRAEPHRAHRRDLSVECVRTLMGD
jgi:hypothetical protein